MNPGALHSYVFNIEYADGTKEEIEFTAPTIERAALALVERKLSEGIKLVVRDDPEGPVLVEEPTTPPLPTNGEAN